MYSCRVSYSGEKKAHADISSAAKKTAKREKLARSDDVDCEREVDKTPEKTTKASGRLGNVQRPGNRRKKIRERKGRRPAQADWAEQSRRKAAGRTPR